MNLDNFIAVSGLPGVYRMAANRGNGLIIEDMSTGKKRFAASRKYQFTPLKSIGIYTDDGDTAELQIVFRNMLQQMEDNPPVDPNASAEELKEYFADVLPNYDRDRVYTSDIKKVIKWFTYLHSMGVLSTEEEISNEEE